MNANGMKFQILKIVIFSIIAVLITIITAKYITDNEFRENLNTKIFGREISQNSLNSIEIDSENNVKVFAFGKSIATFGKNKLNFYNKNAELIQTIDVKLNNPISESSEKYCTIADQDDSRVFLLDELGIKWENEVTGKIYRIHVNSNGYVSVLSKDATFESIITVLDTNGNKLYTKFIAEGYALSAKLANNNEYLAIGRMDYSGIVVKTNIELLSIKNEKDQSHLNSFESDNGETLINMNFNTKNELICMFNSFIEKVTDSSKEKIYDIESIDILVDVNLRNNVIIAQKENTGIFSYKYQIKLNNTVGKSDNLYILENDIPLKIIASEEICCIRFAREIRIINSNGWLVKRYKTTQKIENIVAGSEIIGIVYNNKIEIIAI